MTVEHEDETPALHPIQYQRPAAGTWTPSGIENLPPGWVNVRIWTYDNRLGCDLYVTDECPGVLHRENTVMETVLGWADADGEIVNPAFGELYDPNPVVIATTTVDPPHQTRDFVGPDWQPAIAGGGYLGSCPADMIAEVLAEHGFGDAIPRPDGWTAPDDEAGEPW